jgi:hypothetical protein
LNKLFNAPRRLFKLLETWTFNIFRLDRRWSERRICGLWRRWFARSNGQWSG